MSQTLSPPILLHHLINSWGRGPWPGGGGQYWGGNAAPTGGAGKQLSGRSSLCSLWIAGKELSGLHPAALLSLLSPPSSPPRLIMGYGFVWVCSITKFWGENGFINMNPGFLHSPQPWGNQADFLWVGPCSSSSPDPWVPISARFHLSLSDACSGCLYVTHVYPSLPTALIILFPTLLFGIFHRRKIYYNSRGENSKSLAKFRSRAHLNFYSGFSIYLIYSCLWLRCHIVGVLWPAQACSGRRCVHSHVSLAGRLGPNSSAHLFSAGGRGLFR